MTETPPEVTPDDSDEVVTDLLQEAIDADLMQAVVLGYTQDGRPYLNASEGDVASHNLLADMLKYRVLTHIFGQPEVKLH